MSETSNPEKLRRKRGEARVWQRGRIWWIQYYSNGIQHRESSSSEKEADAPLLSLKRRDQIDADTFVAPAARRLRFEQMREALYADYGANRRKWLRTGKDGKPYICGVSHLDDFFARKRALTITTGRIREFRSERQADGAWNGTISRELAILRRMFNLAVEDGALRTAPHFPMLKEAPPRKGFFEYAQFQTLRQELPEYLRPVATMGYYTGMRRGEILKIRWESVDLKGGEIRLNADETKNEESRTIPLLRELRDMLKIEREKNPDAEFVFIRSHQPISSFYKAWKPACTRANSPDFSFTTFDELVSATSWGWSPRACRDGHQRP